MMCQETVSIIVPVFNAEKYLDRCVKSLLGQTYPNIEIILVDDGSTDNSLSICERYAKEKPNVKVFHTENKGPSNARNLGIEQASGKFIQFVDSDDYLELNMVEKMMAAKKQSKADLIICGYFKDSKQKSESICLLNGVYFFPQFEFTTSSWQIDPIIGAQWNKLFDRDIILNNNVRCPSNLSSSEDYCFCYRYMCFCKRFCIISDVLYHYIIDIPSSLCKVNDTKIEQTWQGQLMSFYELVNLLEVNEMKPSESIAAQEFFSYITTMTFYRRIISFGLFDAIVWVRQSIHTSPYRVLIKKLKKIARFKKMNYVFYILKLIA